MRIFAFIFLLCSCTCYSQEFIASRNLFGNELTFKREFIYNNKIKSVTAEHFVKRDNEKMYPKKTIIKYEFDTLGRLVKQITFEKTPGKDTSIIDYEYNLRHQLIRKRSSDNFGLFSFYYTYNESGFITSETYVREIIIPVDDIMLRPPPKQYPLATEIYQYEYLTPTQVKRKVLNNNGLPYEEAIYNYSRTGKLLDEYHKLIITNRIKKSNYIYDEKENLVSIEDYNNYAGENITRFTFGYDKQGNIITLTRTLQNKAPEKSELLYEEKAGQVTARISRNEETRTIDIVKYGYEFW